MIKKNSYNFDIFNDEEEKKTDDLYNQFQKHRENQKIKYLFRKKSLKV